MNQNNDSIYQVVYSVPFEQNISNSSPDLTHTSSSLTTNNILSNVPTSVTDINNTTQEISLENILKQWNLYDELYDFLTGKKFDAESLLYIRQHHLDDIFDKTLYGVRIKFEHHLFEWQKSLGHYIETSCSCRKNINSNQSMDFEKLVDFLDTENVDTPTNSPRRLDIKHVLLLNEEGTDIFDTYKKTGFLQENGRKDIVNCVVKYFFRKNPSMGVRECRLIANSIIKYFPTELLSTYYFHKGSGKPPGGKIYDKLCTLRKIKKKSESCNGSKSSNEKKSSTKSLFQNKTVDETLVYDPAKSEEIMNELHYLREPWTLIIEKWRETFSYRRRTILDDKSSSITEILQKWPLYKDSRAPELIDSDFDLIYPNSGNIYKKWAEFTKAIQKIYSTRLKSESSRAVFSTLTTNGENIDQDSCNTGILLLLSHILLPTFQGKKGKGSSKKPSIVDSKDNFVSFIKSSGNIEENLVEKRKTLLKENKTLQPLIIVVGEFPNCQEFFVILDDVKYKFNSFLGSVSFCFKLMNVLNINYPIECTKVWLFIQKFFFDISTMYDLKCSNVDTLIKDINNQIQFSN